MVYRYMLDWKQGTYSLTSNTECLVRKNSPCNLTFFPGKNDKPYFPTGNIFIKVEQTIGQRSYGVH